MLPFNKQTFQAHLQKDHKISHFTDYIKEIVYGGNDGMPNSEQKDELLNGLNIFLSFVFFTLIPLLPYFFITQINATFFYSFFCTLFSLMLLGTLRGFITKEPLYRPIIEVVIIGGASALISFFVCTFFRV